MKAWSRERFRGKIFRKDQRLWQKALPLRAFTPSRASRFSFWPAFTPSRLHVDLLVCLAGQPIRGLMRSLPVAAALVAAGLASLHGWVAQAPQTTFRAGTDLVQVDVSVLDHERRPVRGLTAADFTVIEDGKPRPIVAFTAVDLPERVQPSAAPWSIDVGPTSPRMRSRRRAVSSSS